MVMMVMVAGFMGAWLASHVEKKLKTMSNLSEKFSGKVIYGRDFFLFAFLKLFFTYGSVSNIFF